MKPYVPPQHVRGGHPNAIGKRIAQVVSASGPGTIAHPFQWGTVSAVHTGPPKTVDVMLDGATNATLALRYLASYTPTVNDYVLVLRSTGGLSDRVVAGKLA